MSVGPKQSSSPEFSGFEVTPAAKGKTTGVQYVHIKVGDKQFAAYEEAAWKKVGVLRRVACWLLGQTTEVHNPRDGKKYIVLNRSFAHAMGCRADRNTIRKIFTSGLQGGQPTESTTEHPKARLITPPKQ